MSVDKNRVGPDVERGTRSPTPVNNQRRKANGDEYEALLNYVDLESGHESRQRKEVEEVEIQRIRIWYESLLSLAFR